MENVNISKSVTVYSGEVFTILKEAYTSSDGKTQYFEFAKTRDVVRVYPINSQGKIFLISENRYGVLPESISKVLRVVSGGIEKGESPEEGALRELKEEIGLSGNSPYVFHISHPMLKVRNNVYHVLANVDLEIDAHPHTDDFESIKMIPYDLSEIENMVWNGDFAEDIIAFGLLKLCRFLRQQR